MMYGKVKVKAPVEIKHMDQLRNQEWAEIRRETVSMHETPRDSRGFAANRHRVRQYVSHVASEGCNLEDFYLYIRWKEGKSRTMGFHMNDLCNALHALERSGDVRLDRKLLVDLRWNTMCRVLPAKKATP